MNHTHHTKVKDTFFDVPAEGIESLSLVTVILFVVNVFVTFYNLIATIAQPLISGSRHGLKASSQIFRFFAILGRVLSDEFSELLHTLRNRQAIRSEPRQRVEEYQYWKHFFIFSFSIFLLFFVFTAFQYSYTAYAFKHSIEDAGKQGVLHMSEGMHYAKQQDYARAAIEFQISQNSFLYSQELINSINPYLLSVARSLPFMGKKIRDAQSILLAGSNLSKVGIRVLEAVPLVEQIISGGQGGLFPAIQNIQSVLSDISPLITEADLALKDVDMQSFPIDERQTAVSALRAVHDVRNAVEKASEATNALADSIGSATLRRYLVLFQNNAELRPTGGFIGSYALIDVVHGQIRKVEIPPGGPYDLRAGFHERLNPPEPLRLITSQWEFQDANWWADFPTSARKLMWFYEKAGGPTVDGIIAINASFLPRLLSLSGSISLNEYNKTLTTDNAIIELQRAVEQEYDRADNKPKQIIADAFPVVLQSLSQLNADATLQLVSILTDAISKKEIQFFFTNEEYQSLARDFELTGEMKPFSPDYSMLVSTNIGGGKSDAVLSTEVHRDMHVDEKGSITISLALTRTHNGVKGEAFVGVQHNDYLRLYVPAGSKLISASGFQAPPPSEQNPTLQNYTNDDSLMNSEKDKIHIVDSSIDVWNEQGRGVFGGWLLTKPSSLSHASIVYQLPYRFEELFPSGKQGMYAVLLQRQSGSTLSSYDATFEIPAGYDVELNYGSPCTKESGSQKLVCMIDSFERDEFIGFLMTRKNY
ncbi:MAG: DUF4012 domain-containing protein [Patescibacteria group bacterium]